MQSVRSSAAVSLLLLAQTGLAVAQDHTPGPASTAAPAPGAIPGHDPTGLDPHLIEAQPLPAQMVPHGAPPAPPSAGFPAPAQDEMTTIPGPSGHGPAPHGAYGAPAAPHEMHPAPPQPLPTTDEPGDRPHTFAAPPVTVPPNPSVPTPWLEPLPPNRFNIQPPPGTVGRTYRRRTMLIEDEKHPRSAAVIIHLPEGTDFFARGLKSKWNGEYWRLDTEYPLVPGIPHIYAVQAKWTDADGQQHNEVRWVRLIMGRICELDFND